MRHLSLSVLLALSACQLAEVGGPNEEARDVSAAGASKACNATTCPSGCCTTDGTCFPGTANARCGMAGAACMACGSGQSCRSVNVSYYDPVEEKEVAGTHRGCATAEAASNCPFGCTAPDGTCHWSSGQYSVACGMGGSSCQACAAGQACQEVELGGGFVDRTCRTPTGPKWKVIVESVTFGPPQSGGAWDGVSGKADPYVRVSVAASGVMGRTQVVLDSTSPTTFNSYVLTDHESSILNGISVRVMDDDGANEDDYIDSCGSLVTRDDLAKGRLTIDFSAFKVTLRFVPAA